MSPIHLAILASGSGSNAENICNYFSLRSDVKVCVIISNKPDAYVHQRAERLGVLSITCSKSELTDAESFLKVLKDFQIDFVVLAGYLLRIPAGLIKEYPHRIINIHPALLPKYGGKGMYGDRVHEAVVEAREKETGITVHYVNEDYDEGAIIFQAVCPVLEDDMPETVAYKVHALEYLHYPKVVDRVLQKEFCTTGKSVIL